MEREVIPAEKLQSSEREAKVIQAHLLGGDLIVFETWETSDTVIRGEGVRYDPLRTEVARGPQAIALDSVGVFVADREVAVPRTIIGMTILTGVSAALTAACLSNPKSCFGSCPTFYQTTGDRALLAEGYSASIAPSLEDRDVDRLATLHQGGAYELRMTNEALETHVTRRADLLAVPVASGGRAYFAGHGTNDGAFWATSAPASPSSCAAPEGDCTAPLASADGIERFSTSDSTDLAAKESLALMFKDVAPEARYGLAITGRQTLLTTFLVYQGLAYAGPDVGAWVAQAETRNRSGTPTTSPALDMVTRMPVEVKTADGTWQEVGVVSETGPLARDAYLVVLPAGVSGDVEVRLRPTMGAWRIDAVSLVRLDAQVEPVRVSPSVVVREGEGSAPAADADALADLTEDARQLVNLPGVALRLGYEVPLAPEGSSWDLFLESEGYYLEWMRDEWMVDHDPDALAHLLFSPEAALRDLAPMFKAMEAEMDAAFWASRFAAPSAAPLPDF